MSADPSFYTIPNNAPVVKLNAAKAFNGLTQKVLSISLFFTPVMYILNKFKYIWYLCQKVLSISIFFINPVIHSLGIFSMFSTQQAIEGLKSHGMFIPFLKHGCLHLCGFTPSATRNESIKIIYQTSANQNKPEPRLHDSILSIIY